MTQSQQDVLFDLLGRMTIPVIIVVGAIILSVTLTQKGTGQKFVWWPLLVGGLLAVIAVAQIFIQRRAGQNGVSVVQSVAGPASDFPVAPDPAYVSRYGRLLTLTVVQSEQNKTGKAIDASKVSTETSVVEMSAKPVIKTVISIPGIEYFVQFVGTHGKDAINVDCLSMSGEPFKISGSSCEKAAIETFGG